MVVDEDTIGGGADERLLHLVDTTRGVVIETEDEVGNLEEQVALLAMLVVTDDFLGVGHPRQEVGKLIGYDHRGLLADRG